MDDTFPSNCLSVYSPHLYVDASIVFSGFSGGLGSAGFVFKFVWQFAGGLQFYLKRDSGTGVFL